MSLRRTIAIFALIILAFDTLWATVARLGGYNYDLGPSLGFAIYAATGFIAARPARLRTGVAAGTAVATIDALLGWPIAAAIGPGRTSEPVLVVLVVALIGAPLLGALMGLLGAGLSRLPFVRRPVARPASRRAERSGSATTVAAAGCGLSALCAVMLLALLLVVGFLLESNPAAMPEGIAEETILGLAAILLLVGTAVGALTGLVSGALALLRRRGRGAEV